MPQPNPAPMDETDREVLDRYAGGERPRTIANKMLLEVTYVTDTIRVLCSDDRAAAARLVADYDKAHSATTEHAAADTEPEVPATAPDTAPETEPVAETAGPEDVLAAAPEFVDRMAALLAADDALTAALNGPQNELPPVEHAWEVIDLANDVDTTWPGLTVAARQARNAMSALLTEYNRERLRRELRGLIRSHRRQLDSFLDQLAALDAAPAAAEPIADAPAAPEQLPGNREARDVIQVAA